MNDANTAIYRQGIVALGKTPRLTTEESISKLEMMLEACPEKSADVLRIAEGLNCLVHTTPGQKYLNGLRKKVREEKEKRESP